MSKDQCHSGCVPNVVGNEGESIMGHSDIETTMNIYAHSQEENIIAAGVHIADMYE